MEQDLPSCSMMIVGDLNMDLRSNTCNHDRTRRENVEFICNKYHLNTMCTVDASWYCQHQQGFNIMTWTDGALVQDSIVAKVCSNTTVANIHGRIPSKQCSDHADLLGFHILLQVSFDKCFNFTVHDRLPVRSFVIRSVILHQSVRMKHVRADLRTPRNFFFLAVLGF